jgi:hypothetical protein
MKYLVMGQCYFKQIVMKIKTFILVLAAGGFLLSACQKNIDIFVPDPGQLNGPDSTWHNTVTATMPVSILKNNLLLEPYHDSITVGANIASIITPFGIQVNFPPHSCANAVGQIITGSVQVQLMIAKKKGDMIRLNKPSTYNDSMLVTAGQIFIKLTKNGQAVQLAPGVRINIRYVDLPTNSQMKLFFGDETNTSGYNWLPNQDLVNNTVVASTQSYEMYIKQLGWISLAQVYDLGTAAKVSVTVDMASYFTNANTIAFTVFKDLRSTVAMKGDLNTKKFITGKLPVGKQITVVVISRQADDYYLGYESAITQLPATNSFTQHVHVVPIKRSLPEILSYLSTL